MVRLGFAARRQPRRDASVCSSRGEGRELAASLPVPCASKRIRRRALAARSQPDCECVGSRREDDGGGLCDTFPPKTLPVVDALRRTVAHSEATHRD